MQVTQTVSFNQYWVGQEYRNKRPVRNGSRVMLVGDNIYHRPEGDLTWHQLDSHHSHEDGTPNHVNVQKDTKADRVLLSHSFYYFGSAAPMAPDGVLERLGFRNAIGHRVFGLDECDELLQWITSRREAANKVLADPFDFRKGEMRYTGLGSKVA